MVEPDMVHLLNFDQNLPEIEITALEINLQKVIGVDFAGTTCLVLDRLRDPYVYTRASKVLILDPFLATFAINLEFVVVDSSVHDLFISGPNPAGKGSKHPYRSISKMLERDILHHISASSMNLIFFTIGIS